jgi:hypothetical protein
MPLATAHRIATNQPGPPQENWGPQPQFHESEPYQKRVDYGLLDRVTPAGFQLYSM